MRACLREILLLGAWGAAGRPLPDRREVNLWGALTARQPRRQADLVVGLGARLATSPWMHMHIPPFATAFPGAIAEAQRQLDALTEAARGELPAAAALLEERLAEATGRCALARLRLLRAGVLPWEEAWRRHAPPSQQRFRFSGAVDRRARAQALVACAEKAGADAAERTMPLLRQLSSAPRGSRREREKLLYAAGCWVARWWDVEHVAATEARAELRAADDSYAAALAQGEDTLSWLQQRAAAAARAAARAYGGEDDGDDDSGSSSSSEGVDDPWWWR